jgi:hypothetical protein
MKLRTLLLQPMKAILRLLQWLAMHLTARKSLPQ